MPRGCMCIVPKEDLAQTVHLAGWLPFRVEIQQLDHTQSIMEVINANTKHSTLSELMTTTNGLHIVTAEAR